VGRRCQNKESKNERRKKERKKLNYNSKSNCLLASSDNYQKNPADNFIDSQTAVIFI
jgi:hypothetical protein